MGHPRAVPILCELVKTHRPTIIFLFETVYMHKIDEVRVKLCFEGVFSVDREGWSGGIGVLLRNKLDCSMISFSKNHIDMVVSNNSLGS